VNVFSIEIFNFSIIAQTYIYCEIQHFYHWHLKQMDAGISKNRRDWLGEELKKLGVFETEEPELAMNQRAVYDEIDLQTEWKTVSGIRLLISSKFILSNDVQKDKVCCCTREIILLLIIFFFSH